MWEKTVMSEIKIRDDFLPLWIDEEDIKNGVKLAKAQAEITGDIAFKAGQESGNSKGFKLGVIAGEMLGRKEVVEWQSAWLEGYCHSREHTRDTKFKRLCMDCRQAKLKGWGLGDD